MPVKWKIFKVINIINWVLIFPMIMILLTFYFKRLSAIGPRSFHLIFFMFILALVLLLINSIYHFSKTSLSVILNDQSVNFNATTSKLFFALCLLAIIGLMVFFIFGIREEFFNNDIYRNRNDNSGKYVLLYLAVVIGINTYIAVLQIQLLKLHTKAQTETLNQVIDSIGVPGDEPLF